MELIETPVVTQQVQATLTPAAYRAFQLHLILHPKLGKRIPGTGVLRKIRWRVADRCKRGGIRVMYFWKSAADQLFLLFSIPRTCEAICLRRSYGRCAPCSPTTNEDDTRCAKICSTNSSKA